jgi:hypothetical protein
MGLADAVRFITFKDLNWVHVRAAKARSGSKPARNGLNGEVSSGRAEFFALAS